MNAAIELYALLPTASAIIPDPAQQYLSHMCYPLFYNDTRKAEYGSKPNIPSLAYSPFPCEQVLYLGTICHANCSTEVDWLAEQQCLCGGNFSDAVLACDDCYGVHGMPNDTHSSAVSVASSLSAAECSPTPPYQPYTSLLEPPNITAQVNAPPLTLGHDRFPNQTAWSNYLSTLMTAIPGKITGSATGRHTSWISVSLRPTVEPSPTRAQAAPGTTTTGGGQTTATSSPSPSSGAVAVEAHILSGFLPVMLGLGMLV